MNLVKILKDEFLMVFQHRDRALIMEQIFKDIKFLSLHNLMDYSLLLIIETNPEWIEL
jgi:energy-coupling factor transporter ATP-binding protein EcfA2